MPTLILFFAAILCLVSFFSYAFQKNVEKFHQKIISFSAGIFITYIFLNLFPELIKTTQEIGSNAFTLMLAGFLLFHLLEKYLYQHIKNKDALMKDLAELHLLGFFFDHFVVGMVLFFALNTENIIIGSVVFLPLFFHTISSSLALQHIFEKFNKNILVNIFLSASPMLGVLFIYFLNPLAQVYHSIFSFSIGTLFYVVFRDTIPSASEENAKYFIAGVILSGVLTLIANEISATGLLILN